MEPTHSRSAERERRSRPDHEHWGTMISDEQRIAANPEGHPGATLKSGAAGSTPNHQLFGQVTSSAHQKRLYDASLRTTGN